MSFNSIGIRPGFVLAGIAAIALLARVPQTHPVLLTRAIADLTSDTASRTVQQNNSTNFTITQVVPGGTTPTSTLSAVGPSGVDLSTLGISTSFSPASIVGPSTSTLTLTPSTNTPVGTVMVYVQGGSQIHGVSLTLNITAGSGGSGTSPTVTWIMTEGTGSSFANTGTDCFSGGPPWIS